MNYRHAYHAGNFADVVKHVVLVGALDQLGRKETPYFFLDTHAGRGSYLLAAAETQRAGEYRAGVLRVLEASSPPPMVARYLDLVRELGVEGSQLVAYPGSPRIALACMRGNDRAALVESQPREAQALRDELRGDYRAAVHQRDGYEALLGLLPPREKRGAVLVDPPYEQPDEFDRLHEALCGALRLWPAGIYIAWYPLKHGGSAARFLARMAASGIRRQLLVELTVQRDDTPVGLNGGGLLVVNPPWQLDERLAAALPWLHARLAPDGRGRARVAWLVPE